jgi:hypothetical protein
MLSVGLVFVVAGYAWPEDASVTVQAEPNVAPLEEIGASIPAVVESSAPVFIADGRDSADTVDEAESLVDDPGFLETLPELQAGTSERSSQKSVASEVARPTAGAIVGEAAQLAEPAPGQVQEDAAYAAGPDADTLGADARESGAREAMAADEVAQEPADDLAMGATAPALEPDAADSGETSPASVVAPRGTDDVGPEELLIVLGLLLALGGAGLLLVGWLSRRSSDPLLR